MTTNLTRIPEHGHGLSVCALSGLLACVDLADICTWTLRDDNGITGQLTSAYTDTEAYTRIRELAEELDGRLIVRPQTVGHRGPFVAVEAVATTADIPVTVWTHLHDRDARDHALHHTHDTQHVAEGVALR